MIDAIRGWLETVTLVPAAYARYAPLIIDGLLYFLSRLPPYRIDAIVAGQLALTEDASTDERLVALLRECPTLHKLGQVVARQADLPYELRVRLQSLETLLPPPGRYDIDATIARELGAVPGLTLSSQALAEGSVAFVVPFELRDGSADVQRGIFKALKPQAQERLFEDLAIWPELGDYLEERGAQLGLPSLDFRSLLAGVARLLRNEVQLDGEQDQLERARRFYADSPDVVIPELLPLCTPRLTAMRRIDGVKVTDPRLPVHIRRRLAQTITTALLAKPFWSTAATAPIFHADPHAGNLFATPDGRLAIFDWALTTQLLPEQLTAVVQLLLCAVALDEPGVMRALAELGVFKHELAVRESVASAIGDVRRGAFPGFEWLTQLLDRLGRSGSIAFPQATSLFRKSLLTLSGVVRDVWPDASVDAVLLAGGGRQFVAESWLRTLTPPNSRAFGTHVSNDDITSFFASLSWASTRFMLGTLSDLTSLLSAGAQGRTVSTN